MGSNLRLVEEESAGDRREVDPREESVREFVGYWFLDQPARASPPRTELLGRMPRLADLLSRYWLETLAESDLREPVYYDLADWLRRTMICLPRESKTGKPMRTRFGEFPDLGAPQYELATTLLDTGDREALTAWLVALHAHELLQAWYRVLCKDFAERFQLADHPPGDRAILESTRDLVWAACATPSSWPGFGHIRPSYQPVPQLEKCDAPRLRVIHCPASP